MEVYVLATLVLKQLRDAAVVLMGSAHECNPRIEGGMCFDSFEDDTLYQLTAFELLACATDENGLASFKGVGRTLDGAHLRYVFIVAQGDRSFGIISDEPINPDPRDVRILMTTYDMVAARG